MKAKSTMFVAVCLLLVLAWSLTAQTAATGALQGTVTDASGAVIPNATVSLTSTATGQERTATTGADGTYRFPLLPPGNYDLKFTATGFKTAEAKGTVVNVTEIPVFNQKMEVGGATEQVTVQGSAEALQTASSALGTVVGSSEATAIPLTTRNYTNLLGLTAGVAADVGNASALGRGGMEFAVNGSGTAFNTFQMDGVNITSYGGTGFVTESQNYPTMGIPNPDTLAEFKIQTSTYDAGYGRNPGANVNVITKSGSNALHGDAFEFLRDTILNANDFFENRAGGIKQVLNQNQFGGTLGGPIIKDKLFYFLSYQQTGQKNGVAAQGFSSGITLPPIPTGDRSNTAAFTQALGAAMCPANHPGNIQFETFPGFIAPGAGLQVACNGSDINPIAIKFLQAQNPNGTYFIPSSGTANYQSGFAYSIPAIDNEYQGMLNIDYLINTKQTLAFRFYRSVEPQTVPFPPGSTLASAVPALPGTTGTDPLGYHNMVTKLTTIVTNSLVNELHASYQRTSSDSQQHPPTSTYASNIYGTPPGTNQLGGGLPFSPVLEVLGLFSAGGSIYYDNVTNNFQAQIGDQISWNVGKHTIRAGGEIEQVNWVWDFTGLSHGSIWFPSFNDFLIGLPGDCGPAVAGSCNGTPASNILQTVLAVRSGADGIVHGYRAKNGYAFLQDDIKVSRRFTLNAGLRWEYDGLMADKYGNSTTLWLSELQSVNNPATFPSSPATATPAGWVVAPNYDPTTWGKLPAGVFQRQNAAPTKNGVPLDDFAPRLGFAWQPFGDKLVIRSGAGFFYNRVPGSTLAQSITQGPPYSDTLDQGSTTNQFSSLAEPFSSIPAGTFPARWLNFANNSGSDLSTSFNVDRLITPLVYEWNLNLQYQLAPTWTLEAGYVGSRGIHLMNSTQDLNGAMLASPEDPINGVTENTVGNTRLRVPYLGFSPTGLQALTNQGDFKYNGLQVTLRKQISHGLTFQAAYTFAKSLTTQGNNLQSNVNNPLDPVYGQDPAYRPQRLVINYTYEIPSKLRGPAGVLTKGWSISGITTIQDGDPLTVWNSTGGLIYGQPGTGGGGFASTGEIAPGMNYGNLITPGGVQSRLGGASGGPGYVNVNALAPIPIVGATPGVPGTGGTGYGNMGVGIILGPGEFNFDTVFAKATRVGGIHENAVLQFRAEFFNLFNHPQFANPAMDAGSGNFGQITSASVNPRLTQLALKYVF
ncbi:MAG: carboxypeptidase-like regulatory domain-containing protein [Bryobacteraceae bacterium]